MDSIDLLMDDPIEILSLTATTNTQTNLIIIKPAGSPNVRFKVSDIPW